MRPSKLLLLLLVLWIIVGIVDSLNLTELPVWSVFGAVLLGLAIVDCAMLFLLKTVQLSRQVPPRMALGIVDEIVIDVKNLNKQSIELRIFDAIPSVGEAPELPLTGKAHPISTSRFKYKLRMLERGLWDLEPAHVEWRSPMGFWLRKKSIGVTDQLKVYPNYEPTIRYAVLALANQQSQMGISSRNLLGMSKEFRQLRDYQEGDVLSQIDWKATSRHLSLVSREYEEQKDQNLILMLDTGRRMRAMDGDLAHFDHCLNAVMLVSYLALQHDDLVSILGFGGSEKWLPPVKGAAAIPKVLEHLYDYQTSTDPSDFSEAAARLLALQKRRAMVVIVTNLRGEDADDLLPAIEILRRRHIVVVTSLREKAVMRTIDSPVATVEDALLYGATSNYLEERHQLIETLRNRGVTVVDTDTTDLPIAISNAYLQVRKST